MKVLKKLFAAAAIAVFFAPSPPAAAREVIKTYDVDIRINRDSSMTVTENITASVENIEIKKGIIRVFPVEYQDALGRSVRVGFEVLEAKIDGRATQASVSGSGRYKEVRIGDPDRLLPHGDRTFTITYRTTKQLGFFDGFDELYWNVTGNDWTFPILSASCRVALPGKGYGESFNSIEWYTGAYGEKGNPRDAMLLPDGTVKTTRALRVREGLTVVYTWPKGFVNPPPPPKTDNTAAQTVIGAVTFTLVLLWMGYAWRKWGNTSDAEAVIPRFYPPDGMSPAQTHYLYNNFKLYQTGFAAEIIDLAVRRAIKIREEKGTGISASGTIILEKEESLPANLLPREETLLRQLFPFSGPGGNTLELKQSNRQRLTNARNSLLGGLWAMDEKMLRKNTAKLLPAVGLYFLGVAALYPFSGDLPVTMIISGAAGAIIILSGMRGGEIKRTLTGNIRQFITRLFPAAVIGGITFSSTEVSGFDPTPALCFLAAAGMISAMRPLVIALTQTGNSLISKIEGLRLYMGTAEKSRLEMFNPPEETPELFERLLPYALALGVAKTWGDRFANVLTAAQYEPAWYVGPSPYIFMNGGALNSFSSNLQSQMTSSMRTPSAPPGSSSGSSGGGFSGGGGGGGGGRGW